MTSKAGRAKQAVRRRAKARAASRQPEFLAVGKILRPHGVRGELRVEVHTGYPRRLAEVETIYIGDDHLPCGLEASRTHQDILLIKLRGYDDRTQADALRGQIISVAVADASPLKSGEYYYHQIIGLPVVSDAGEPLGLVTEILETGANDVYVVQGPGGQLLLPAIKSVILKIEANGMLVHLIEGLR